MPSFRDWLKNLAPTWLLDDGGKAVLGMMGQQLDDGVQATREAVKARFPTLAPADAVADIGADRQIPQAPWETDIDYRRFLRDGAWSYWGGDEQVGGAAGTPAGILLGVARAGIPFRFASDPAGSPDATTYVQWNGRWVQLYQDGRTPIFGMLDGCVTRPGNQPGWFDGNESYITGGADFVSQSYLLFPTPGGVVAGLDNSPTNALKAKLNAIVKLRKRASETYGGAFVFDSTDTSRPTPPPGSEFWWMTRRTVAGGCLGWPPSTMDGQRVFSADTFVIPQNSSLKIDPS